MAERWLKDVLEAAEKSRQASPNYSHQSTSASSSPPSLSADRAKEKRIKNQMVKLLKLFGPTLDDY